MSMTKYKREKLHPCVIDTNCRIRTMINWDTDKLYYLNYGTPTARRSIGEHRLY